MEQEVIWFIRLAFGAFSLIGVGASLYVLIRISVNNWRYARYEREVRERNSGFPPEPPLTDEEAARLHAEKLADGWTCEYPGVYSKPADPDRQF